MKYKTSIMMSILLSLFIYLFITPAWAKEEATKIEHPATQLEKEKETLIRETLTAADPYIDVDELQEVVTALTKEELEFEAKVWFSLLRDKMEKLAHATIAVKRQTKELKKAAEVVEKVEAAKESLQEVESTSKETQEKLVSGEVKDAEEVTDSLNEMQEVVSEAEKAVEEVKTAVKEAVELEQESAEQEGVKEAAKEAVQKAVEKQAEEEAKIEKNGHTTAPSQVNKPAESKKVASKEEKETEEKAEATVEEANLTEATKSTEENLSSVEPTGDEALKKKGQELEKIGQAAKKAAEKKEEVKTHLLENLNDIREQKTKLIDRLNVILNELDKKGGDTNNYRLYVAAVGGIKVDVTDTKTALSTIKGWIKSEEGGLRWAKNFITFFSIVIAFWVVAIVVSSLVGKVMSLSKNSPTLFRKFIVITIRRVTTLVGIIVGLTALEINVGPIFAVLGAASFVLAFALQGTLSNFANGLMILFYKPFDISHSIEVSGVKGKVHAMNLVSTNIRTADGKSITIPNNAIWGNVIINATDTDSRRIDMIFRISYKDDLEKTAKILREILNSHPLIIKEPEGPVVELHELSEYSINIACRPWVKVDNYMRVYWDITKQVKTRFDQEGISIPMPQQEIYLHKKD